MVELGIHRKALPCCSSSLSNTHTKAPLRVFECVGSRQVSSEIVSQQYHFLQPHPFPPLLQGFHELLLCPLWVARKSGSAAPAEAQKVQSINRATAGERVQVLGPQSNPASKAVQQNQRRPVLGSGVGERAGWWMSGESYGPQVVAGRYADVLPAVRLLHTCRGGYERRVDMGTVGFILTASELFILILDHFYGKIGHRILSA